MCSRFESTVSPETIGKRFGIVAPEGYRPAAEIRPDNAALIVTAEGGLLSQFGLKAAWDNKLILNARRETIDQRKTFVKLLEQRCLIPATGWYEWRAEPGVRGKIKYRLRRSDSAPFALAGLYDGTRMVIVTRAAQASIADIHDRMPAILPRDGERQWIAPGQDFAAVAGLLERLAPEIIAERITPRPPLAALL